MSGGSRGLGVSGPPSSACAGVAGLASLSRMPAASDPQVLGWGGHVVFIGTCGLRSSARLGAMDGRDLLGLSLSASDSWGWGGWVGGGMVAVPDPHFLRRFHDKRSYTDTHILSLCRSLTAKLYFMFVYLPLLCQVLCIV